MTRILQITPYYPPQLGGVERVAESLAAGLGRRHDVRVVTTTIGARTVPRFLRTAGVTVRRHRAVEFAHTPLAPGLLVSLLREPRTSILHLHAAQAGLPELVALVARARRQPFVFHFHLDVDASGRLGRLLPLYKKHALGRVLRAAAAVIVLTEAQSSFVRDAYGVRAERVFIVPNGVDRAYFMAAREITHRPLRLLFVGRLSVQKNIGRLLDAMSLVRQPVELRIVGDGEQRELLEARVARLGLTNVTFAGRRLGPDLVRSYADVDMFVLPSDKEGMSLAALEAMAAALPIVATAVPGNTELLDGVGLLADPDPVALAAAISAVADDPALRLRLSRQSASAATGYSWDAVVRRVEDVYAEVLP
ncbi:glycosyltransferase family 4 protein [Streptomyces sp. AS02]|uniref:glycosyltransferase family 4 protein n=1 Tax=Streptomyces sp. AS02 TaxID=2938946 RepID=UPI0020225695|nr:glycosyltransferase family 4 protein [Streptomyces sp. AS02]MCL8012096.1 glycosyltransferase family 4 protein [Streptomyces sp. AS02]